MMEFGSSKCGLHQLLRGELYEAVFHELALAHSDTDVESSLDAKGPTNELIALCEEHCEVCALCRSSPPRLVCIPTVECRHTVEIPSTQIAA
jgi:hypothetical protein